MRRVGFALRATTRLTTTPAAPDAGHGHDAAGTGLHGTDPGHALRSAIDTHAENALAA